MSGDLLRFETGVATDVGCRRTENEDASLVHEGAGLWAVADGMGGHRGGALASAAAVAALREIGPPASAAELLASCERAAILANERIRALGQGGIVGTTLVALLTHGEAFAGVWCGDSRLYRVSDGLIEQWTEDHTEVQELLAAGTITPEQAAVWPRRNVVTRALGVFAQPELDIRTGVAKPGDAFVLCSDGLTNHVEAGEIRDAVGAGPDAQAAADALVRLTLERGASDNVTAVVVRCLSAREPTVVLPLFGARPAEGGAS